MYCCVYLFDHSYNIIKHVSILFADDTSVFIERTNYDKMIDILDTELKRIDILLKSNKLSIII